MAVSPPSTAALASLFTAAGDNVGVIVRKYRIGGLTMRMRFAGPAMLERISGSFAHLRVAGDTHSAAGDDVAAADAGDELTIDIWDSASTGTRPAPVVGTPITADGTGPIYYSEADGVRALSRWGTLSVLDAPTRRAWFWTADAAGLLSWDWASPLRLVLHWWLGDHGILLVHGGAVGGDGGGVLVVGRGGSGKSTTTLSCLSAGLRYAGDDFVGLSAPPRPRVHSLYSSGKLESHHLARFAQLRSAVANPDRLKEEKAIVLVARSAPELPIAGFPLKAVLVPRVVADDPQTRAVLTSSASALAALAPSTVFQLYPPHPRAMSIMAALVRCVPCYSLELGSDVQRIPETIIDILDRS